MRNPAFPADQRARMWVPALALLLAGLPLTTPSVLEGQGLRSNVAAVTLSVTKPETGLQWRDFVDELPSDWADADEVMVELDEALPSLPGPSAARLYVRSASHRLVAVPQGMRVPVSRPEGRTTVALRAIVASRDSARAIRLRYVARWRAREREATWTSVRYVAAERP